MRKLIFLFSFFILFHVSALAQKVITKTVDLTVAGVQIVQTNSSSYSTGAYAIGKDTSGSNINIYRTYFPFNLNSIPANATISQVTVSYSNGSSGYTLKLTQLATIKESDLAANWAAIGTSSSLHTGLAYNGTQFNSVPIKDAIQKALPNKIIYIGALSESESKIGSYSSMSLSLTVTFTYPAEALSILVQNDLDGAGNAGSIGVGTFPSSPISRISPFLLTAYVDDQLNLAAYDMQSVNSYNWIFNNTEGPTNNSYWDKYVQGFHSKWTDAQTFTTSPLTSDYNNSTITAKMKKIKSTTAGALTEDEYWFTYNIGLSGDVTVPTGRNLRLGKGITLKLNGYAIISTGGTITDDGATFPDLVANIKTSSNVIVGYYGRIQKACDAASSGQKIEIKPGAYNESFSLSSKSSVTISAYGATINGSINLINDSYCNLYGVYLPTGQVYTSGGIGIVIVDVRSDAGGYSLSLQNTSNNAVYGLTATNGNGADFGVNIYNSTGDICSSSRIENQMIGIYLSGTSRYNVTEDYFCQNELDVDAEGGAYAYLLHNTYSRVHPISAYGNYFGPNLDSALACSSPSSLAKSNTASLSRSTQTKVKGTPAGDLDRLYLELIHRTSQDTSLDHKGRIEKYKAEYLSIAEKSKGELKKNLRELSRLKNSLSLVVNCLGYLGEDESLKSYLNELLRNSDFQSFSPYIKKYFIPGLVKSQDFNGALAQCEEILNSKDIDQDLTCEMLYEKGIINRFYLQNNTEAYRAFSAITVRYPNHPLGKMAKGQISEMPDVQIGNPGLKSLGSNSEGFTCSNYPNPFNPSTRFTFSIPGDGFTELKIYNSLGQEVKTLVSDYLTKGKYTFEWNAGSYSSGIYYYFLKSGSNVTTSKIILLK